MHTHAPLTRLLVKHSCCGRSQKEASSSSQLSSPGLQPAPLTDREHPAFRPCTHTPSPFLPWGRSLRTPGCPSKAWWWPMAWREGAPSWALWALNRGPHQPMSGGLSGVLHGHFQVQPQAPSCGHGLGETPIASWLWGPDGAGGPDVARVARSHPWPVLTGRARQAWAAAGDAGHPVS